MTNSLRSSGAAFCTSLSFPHPDWYIRRVRRRKQLIQRRIWRSGGSGGGQSGSLDSVNHVIFMLQENRTSTLFRNVESLSQANG